MSLPSSQTRMRAAMPTPPPGNCLLCGQPNGDALLLDLISTQRLLINVNLSGVRIIDQDGREWTGPDLRELLKQLL